MSEDLSDAARQSRAYQAQQLLEHPLLRDAMVELERERLELSVMGATIEEREEARHDVRALRQVVGRLKRWVDDLAVRPVRRHA